MIRKFLFLVLFLACVICNAQVGVNTVTPDPSATLHVDSTSGGILIPRVTTSERDLIADPANGLLIYNTDSDEFQYNSNTPGIPIWQAIDTVPASTSNIGQSIKYSNTDITTNVNVDTAINVPLLGTLNWNDNTTLYTVNTTTNEITINETGRYKIVVNVPLVTGGTRDRLTPEMRITVGGTQTGTYSSTGYIRTNNGHQESSLHITEILELTTGSVIAVDIFRTANSSNNAANAVTIREAGSANIYIEKTM